MRHDTKKQQPKPEATPEFSHAAQTRPVRVRCNGGAQGSGHPAVYLSLNDEGFVVCPYCSQRFEKHS